MSHQGCPTSPQAAFMWKGKGFPSSDKASLNNWKIPGPPKTRLVLFVNQKQKQGINKQIVKPLSMSTRNSWHLLVDEVHEERTYLIFQVMKCPPPHHYQHHHCYFKNWWWHTFQSNWASSNELNTNTKWLFPVSISPIFGLLSILQLVIF